MKKSHIIIIVAVCVALLVGGFAFWMNRNGNTSSENVELTKVQQIITKDLTKNYPATPREVVKTYIEITTCFYGEEYTEKELEALADQTLLLMDEELAENNPKEKYIKAIKAEIANYKELERTIVNYELPKSNEVEFHTQDGYEHAFVDTSYFIKEKTGYSKTYQRYVLRKDENGNWKIHWFGKIEGDTSDEK